MTKMYLQALPNAGYLGECWWGECLPKLVEPLSFYGNYKIWLGRDCILPDATKIHFETLPNVCYLNE